MLSVQIVVGAYQRHVKGEPLRALDLCLIIQVFIKKRRSEKSKSQAGGLLISSILCKSLEVCRKIKLRKPLITPYVQTLVEFSQWKVRPSASFVATSGALKVP